MTIIRLYFDKSAKNGYFVAVNDLPKVATKGAGCGAAWNTVSSCGGSLLISDEPIEGWGEGITNSDHFYIYIAGKTIVLNGGISFNVWKNLGFKFAPDWQESKLWWWSANGLHKIKKEDKNKIEAYYAGRFEAEPEPEPFFNKKPA